MRKALFGALLLLGLGPRVIPLGEKAGNGEVLPALAEIAVTVFLAYVIAMLVEKLYRRLKRKSEEKG